MHYNKMKSMNGYGKVKEKIVGINPIHRKRSERMNRKEEQQTNVLVTRLITLAITLMYIAIIGEIKWI